MHFIINLIEMSDEKAHEQEATTTSTSSTAPKPNDDYLVNPINQDGMLAN